MMEDLGTSDLSSPASNGASGGSASGLSVRSSGVPEAFAGGNDKEVTTVAKRFLIAEIKGWWKRTNTRSSSKKNITSSASK